MSLVETSTGKALSRESELSRQVLALCRKLLHQLTRVTMLAYSKRDESIPPRLR